LIDVDPLMNRRSRFSLLDVTAALRRVWFVLAVHLVAMPGALANEELEDGVYAAERLLEVERCTEARRHAVDLLRRFPEKPVVHRLNAEISRCLGEAPERIYGHYKKFLAAGGSEEDVARAFDALAQELAVVEVHLEAPMELKNFDWGRIQRLRLEPVFVLGRDDAPAIELEGSEPGHYWAAGVLAGRYELKIDTDCDGRPPLSLQMLGQPLRVKA
jgi:hypothetical protein